MFSAFPGFIELGLRSTYRKQKSPLTLVVNLDVPDQVILNRISDRWVHLPSGRVYNTSYNPPRVAGIDDVTGEALTRRPDDNPVRTLLIDERQSLTRTKRRRSSRNVSSHFTLPLLLS